MTGVHFQYLVLGVDLNELKMIIPQHLFNFNWYLIKTEKAKLSTESQRFQLLLLYHLCSDQVKMNGVKTAIRYT